MTDVFRKEYKPLSDDQKTYVDIFKAKADELMHEFECAEFLNPDRQRISLAKFALEECVMWAVKSIT